MEYRKFNDAYYIRMDRGDEIVSSLLDLCRKEKIASAVYSGIGGCGSAEVQTFDPSAGSFRTRELSGVLELVSLNGNVISDKEGNLFHHTHALLVYNEDGAPRSAGGHMKSLTVLYTAEIKLCPVCGGSIGYKHDGETGTGFWAFPEA